MAALIFFQRGLQSSLFFGAKRASQQLHTIRRLREQAFDTTRVLLRENFCRRHQSSLEAIFHRRHHRNHGDDGFAAADVTLQQTVHRRFGFHVVENLLGDVSLGLC